MNECFQWFLKHPHLGEHVRHVQIWFPVWGERIPCSTDPLVPRRATMRVGINNGEVIFPAADRYHRAHENVAINEIFYIVKRAFASARILTLEGGTGVKASLVQLYGTTSEHPPHRPSHQSKLYNIDTLVMRGAWNLMACYQLWVHITDALPNLKECQLFYNQAQKQTYITSIEILGPDTVRPNTIRHFTLSLEGFSCTFDNPHLPIPKPVLHPICNGLGKRAVTLETISFTGRVCADVFRAMRREVLNSEEVSVLRSMDLLVKACCRNNEIDCTDGKFNAKLPICHALTGINNTHFNAAFHEMVLEAIRALAVLPNLKYVRIRYMDLDGPSPLQNPYFELKDDKCTGLWSDEIRNALRESRPEASFVELRNGIEPVIVDGQLVGATSPTARPLSIRAGQYVIIAEQRLP